MSGAPGAPGRGAGDDSPPTAEPTTITDGATGADPGGDRSRPATTRGGTTMTRPTDSYSQGGQGNPQQDQHYRPPQAYPAPPGGAAGGDAGKSGPRPDETTQLRPQKAARITGPGQPGQQSQPSRPPQTERKARTGARVVPRVRKARLRVGRADPWSVMKVSFLLSIALGICTIVAVSVLWLVMDAMGVFSSIGDLISEATGTEEGGGFDLQAFLSLGRVLTFTTVIAIIDVVLVTALATLGAFMYNLSAGFVGGVELTLAEDE